MGFAPQRRWNDGLERVQLLARGLLFLIVMILASFMLDGCASANQVVCETTAPRVDVKCGRHGKYVVCSCHVPNQQPQPFFKGNDA